MRINPVVLQRALDLRWSIEVADDGANVGQKLLDLVDALGGNPNLVREFTGRPHLSLAYITSLILTQPE